MKTIRLSQFILRRRQEWLGKWSKLRAKGKYHYAFKYGALGFGFSFFVYKVVFSYLGWSTVIRDQTWEEYLTILIASTIAGYIGGFGFWYIYEREYARLNEIAVEESTQDKIL